MRKYILVFLTTILTSNIVLAQLPSKTIGALSPNSANLGLFGDIPVSYFNGLPQIKVPLYTISENGLSIPIDLNYHAGGVYIEQHPGWVGMNWNLSTGGAIIRKARDIPDEKNYTGAAGGIHARSGFLYTNQRPNLQNVMESKLYMPELNGYYSNPSFDGVPDEFYFTTPTGISGYFYAEGYEKWQVKSDRPIKIDSIQMINSYYDIGHKDTRYPFNKRMITDPAYDNLLFGFRLTTEDGIQYHYGYDWKAVEFMISLFDQEYGDWITNTWNLTKIVFPNGDEINYTYEWDNFISQIWINVYYEFNVTVITEGMGDLQYNDPVTGFDVRKFYNGSLILPSYLKQIKTKQGSIHFDRSKSSQLRYKKYDYKYFADYIKNNTPAGYEYSIPYQYLQCGRASNMERTSVLWDDAIRDSLQWQKLDRIRVVNNNNELVRDINFTYNNNEDERLFLQTVEEKLSNSKYIFNYNNPNLLPDYLSDFADHWGFYNRNNSSQVDYINFSNYFKEKDKIDLTLLMYGMLTKIVYPTGGYSVFEYEPHEYRKQVKFNRWLGYDFLTENKKGGGLRIKKIESFDGSNLVDKREYFYTTDYDVSNNGNISSGIMGGSFKYYIPEYINIVWAGIANSKIKASYFSSQSFLPSCLNSINSHIGYTTVFEKNMNNSYTKYTFTNFDNGYLDDKYDYAVQDYNSMYLPCNSRALERGHLLLKEDYTNNGKPVYKQEKTYLKTKENFISAMYSSTFSYTFVHKYKKYVAYSGDFVEYKIYTYSFLPKSITETYYDPVSSKSMQTIEKKYSYNDDKLLQLEAVKNSKDETIETHYQYSGDIEIKNKKIELLWAENDRKEYARLDQNFKDCIYDCGTDLDGDIPPMCLADCERIYTDVSDKYRKEMDMYRAAYRTVYWNKVNEIASGIVELSNSGAIGRLTSKTQKLIKNNKTSILNSEFYKYKKNDYGHIVIDSRLLFEAYNKDDAPNGELYTFDWVDSRYITDAVYKYNCLENVIEIKDRTSVTTYLWSYSGQYPIAEIKNATYEEVKQALGWNDDNINTLAKKMIPSDSDMQLINNLRQSLPNANISTYEYTPLVGLKKSTDSRGVITTYQYDPYGRLKTIRDHQGNPVESFQYNYRNK